jgi:hypothetical protein
LCDFRLKEPSEMPEVDPITAETVTKMAAQLLRLPFTPADAAATAGMLNGLAADMQALRKMKVDDEEPATTYAAVEGEP